MWKLWKRLSIRDVFLFVYFFSIISMENVNEKCGKLVGSIN